MAVSVMYYEHIVTIFLFEFFQYTNLILIRTKRVVASFDFPCDPMQFTSFSSPLVNFTANSFNTTLCHCGVFSKIVITVLLLEGVKTAGVGISAVGTCIEGAHELEFVELYVCTPVIYCGTNKS